MRLISVGNVIVDLVVSLPALPGRGGDVVAAAAGMSAGGSFNTLTAAVRQGLSAQYAGAHGVGPFGDLVRAQLTADGVGWVQAPTPGVDTGFDIAMTELDGERTFITAFGAEAQLSAEQLKQLRPAVDDFVHVSGYGLLARTNGAVVSEWLTGIDPQVTVFLDPGPLAADIPAQWWSAVSRRANWISCNETEAEALSGLSDPVQAAEALAVDECGVIVRVGANGAILADADGPRSIPGFPVILVDANGAGDAHAGAFLAGLARNLPPADAVLVANACAALAVTRSGPATAPTLAQTLEFMAANGSEWASR